MTGSLTVFAVTNHSYGNFFLGFTRFMCAQKYKASTETVVSKVKLQQNVSTTSLLICMFKCATLKINDIICSSFFTISEYIPVLF